MWYGFLLSFILVSCNRECCARLVYIDGGANWANTMRLYRDIANASKLNKPWEIYAFEASPFLQSYLEAFTEWLNGRSPPPHVLLPPAGSTHHLAMYASRYGCNDTNPTQMRSCMWRIFNKPLQHLPSTVAPIELIKERLDIARLGIPVTESHDRYVYVPAAMGAEDGEFRLSLSTRRQMLRGGACSSGRGGVNMEVPVVDVVTWMAMHFRREDYLVVKLDIEGAEFPVLETLLNRGFGHLIDTLLLECHDHNGDCSRLRKRLHSEAPDCKLFEEGRDYDGYDSFSTPDLYYPVDPRSGLGGAVSAQRK